MFSIQTITVKDEDGKAVGGVKARGCMVGQRGREEEGDNDECGLAVLIALLWLAISPCTAKPG